MDLVGLLLDVSPPMGLTDGSGSTYLEKCKDIISLFLQRKIFSCSSDRVCLFTYGSNQTANELSVGDDYQHVSMEWDLRTANWDLCSHIQKNIENGTEQADLLDALVVVSTYIINYINAVEDKKVKKMIDEGRRIIMVYSTLDNPAHSESLSSIIGGFKDNRIEIFFIGPSMHTSSNDDDESSEGMDHQPSTSTGTRGSDSSSKPKTVRQIKAEGVAQKIIAELDGLSFDFREAFAAVSTFDNKKKNSMAWNADLVIGTSLKLPISAFKMVTRDPLPSFKKCAARNTKQEIEVKYDTYLPDGMDTVVDKEDVIKGFRYGTDLIPITDDDMANMKYKCDTKEFSVIGFTKESNVKRHYYSGKDSMMVTAQKGDPVVYTALSAFVRALFETQMIAVVRRIYRANDAPRIGALHPVIESGREFLCYIELPFMEDMRELEFPPLHTGLGSGDAKSNLTPSPEQLEAVDELISAMDMSVNGDEDPDILDPKNIQNPNLQRLFQVLSSKAMDEKCQVPEMTDAMRNLIHNNTYTSLWSADKQTKFSELFKLEKVKQDKSSKGNLYKDSTVGENISMDVAGDNLVQPTVRSLDQERVTAIQTVNPVSDFMLMVQDPSLQKKAFIEMTVIIRSLITESVGTALYKKCLTCIHSLRNEAVKLSSRELITMVNDFLINLKSLLHERDLTEFWSLMVEEKLSLIDHSEADCSDVTPETKLNFLSTVTAGDTLDNDDDLLDLI